MDEQKDLIEEINRMKEIFLLSFCEETGYLKIKICGAKYEDYKEEMDCEFNLKGIEKLIKGAKNVIEDTSIVYEIVFESYIAYSTRWESYTTRDEDETFSLGNNFRVYSQSKFLEYIKNSTFASCVTEYHHYEILCEWQIIDIASSSMPNITKYIL